MLPNQPDKRAESQTRAGSTRFQDGSADPGPSRERLDRPAALTFARLSEVNRQRASRWHPGFPARPGDPRKQTVDSVGPEGRQALAQALHRTFISSNRSSGASIPDLIDSIITAGWRPYHTGPDADWTGADWSNAACGEAGEMANVVKKLRRYECGLKGQLDPAEPELRSMLADEIADVICYVDLLATYYGIDVAAAVTSKFNRVSERQDFPERLP